MFTTEEEEKKKENIFKPSKGRFQSWYTFLESALMSTLFIELHSNCKSIINPTFCYVSKFTQQLQFKIARYKLMHFWEWNETLTSY